MTLHRRTPRLAALLVLAYLPIASATAVAQTKEHLHLFVAPGVEGIDAARLRDAMESELGVDVQLSERSGAAQTLSVRPEKPGSVTVAFEGATRRVGRVLALPRAEAARVEAITLLAGNLARDEASELLASLQAPASEHPEADSEAPATATRSEARDPPAESATATPAAPPTPSVPPDPVEQPRQRTAPGLGREPSARSTKNERPIDNERRPPRMEPPHCSDPRHPEVVAGADLAPGAGTSAFQGTSAARGVSVNLLAGLSGGLRGLELSGLAGIDRGFACGVQVAGGLNLVGGPVEGLQLAGGVNVAAGALHGVQVSGGYNHARGVRGGQLGAVNVDDGLLEGAQLGVVQVASETSGAQVGVANFASGRVRGIQIGLFNYADDSDASIGLVSILKNGRTQFDSWIADWRSLGVAVKHGGRRLHNLYGAGVHGTESKARPVLFLGLGLHFEPHPSMYVDVDAIQSWSIDLDDGKKSIEVSSLRVPVGGRLSKGFALYAGPTYNVSVTHGGDREKLSFLGGSSLHESSDTSIVGWPGLVVGAQAL